MDERIKKAIEEGHERQRQAAESKRQQEEIIRQKHLEKIEQDMPRARKWVEDNILNKISGYVARGEHQMWLAIGEDNIDIETASIERAIKEIDGLRISTEWVKGYNDPDGGPPVYDHFNYYVSW